MSTTIRDQQALERYARQHERELRFLRHSPREERWIPFVDDRKRVRIRDAAIGLFAFIAFIGAVIVLSGGAQ
jgi:hypothetical protein